MNRLVLPLLAAALACASPRVRLPPEGLDDAAAVETLRGFAAALEAGRFDEAHAFLSARWRAAYTPGRLALDYRGAGPLAREAAARVLARLAQGARPDRGEGRAAMRLDGAGEAVLVAEGGAWRVDALE